MSGSRVSTPETLQKTIDEIKAAIGNKHSDEDIYTVLEDCEMDADETIRKFLYLETFQEVKSKHQKKVVSVSDRRGDNHYSSYNNGGRQFNARQANNGPRSRGRASKSSNKGSAVASSVANGSSNHESTSRSATTNKSSKRPEKLKNIVPGSDPGPTPASTPVVSKSGTAAAGKPSNLGQLSSQSDPVLDPSLNPRNHGAIQRETRIQNVKDNAVENYLCSKQAALKPKLQISGRPRSVIFPNNLRIPEDIKSTLMFGTMDMFLEQSNDTEASKNASQTPESSLPISDQPQENINIASSAGQTKQETINYALQGENGTQIPTQTCTIVESSAAVLPQTYHYIRQHYPSCMYNHYYGPQLYMTPPAAHNFPSVRSMPPPQSLHQLSMTPPLSSLPVGNIFNQNNIN
ncbi:hypothetical protein CASFOL_014084 [Castilleja foliolosa]|uniref:GBF-interacting protein 1 N-terminal domain-containing protein n=1 Tax=Castilleja foliolosa TaxID=1961234 RepID=A0ABD3DQU6_9LAMI